MKRWKWRIKKSNVTGQWTVFRTDGEWDYPKTTRSTWLGAMTYVEDRERLRM